MSESVRFETGQSPPSHEPSDGSAGDAPSHIPASRAAGGEPPPTFVYDGDCGFCRMWAARWAAQLGDRVAFRPYQTAAGDFSQIPRDRFAEAAQFIDPDGTVYEGAAAIFRALAHRPRRSWMWWAYRKVPLFKPVSDLTYRFVADHRPAMTSITRFLWGDVSEPPRYVLTPSIFLRLLGVVYLIAFLSLGSQILGLTGENGIMPVRLLMDWQQQRLASSSMWERLVQAPTLSWFFDSDASLIWQCRGGAILSVLLILGIAPIPVLIALWALYLSLSISQGIFLSFQWDTLLTEAGFLAIFFAPWQLFLRFRSDRTPSRLALWMLRLLIFKLMFLSGLVKLTSGDPTWRDYTALTYHYETQPLPAWTSWYAHQLPLSFQQVCLVVVFAIELVIPFLIFAPRRLRHVAAFSFAFLMLMIGLTGNYNFFNLLTVVLCVPLLDDRCFRAMTPAFLRRPTKNVSYDIPRRPARAIFLMLVLAAYTYISAIQGVRGSWPRWKEAPAMPAFAASETAVRIVRAVAPFRTINAYGLFRVMTTTRPEIIIEGSRDGKTWKPYEFPWKPGDVFRRPEFVQPHQPRLDWQMWFAALGSYQRNPWVRNLMLRLLEGSPDVLSLFAGNPFPDEPPKYIRAVLYRYHFSDPKTRRTTGAWWTRERIGLYAPVLAR